MKLESLEIKNLRAIKNVKVSFGNYSCLVGPNGSGKSTVLFALNVLFQESTNSSSPVDVLAKEDFFGCKTEEPIEIIATFTNLSDAAKQDFNAYVRQDKLVISALAEFNGSSGEATVKRFGQRLGMEAFRPFFAAYGDKDRTAAKLRTIYQQLKENFRDLPTATAMDAMADALREYEAARPNDCVLQRSDDLFYGVSAGSDRLEKYIQWVFVPAVKDASNEQIGSKNTALGKLLDRTVRARSQFGTAVDTLLKDTKAKYQEILDQNQNALDGISSSLQQKLVEWAHPDATVRLSWQQNEKSVRVEEPFATIVAGEANFEGELVRLGHGFQRSYLLALLQELASTDDTNAPNLLLGCEEPELYQHPPQARHLANVFARLASRNSQIVVATHSPLFVSGEHFESVRLVRRDTTTNSTSIANFSLTDLAAQHAKITGDPPRNKAAALTKVHQCLQPVLNEMFFAPYLVLVEGMEDVAYLHSWLALSGRWEDFRRCGCHVVPVDGKSELLRPAMIAKGMNIPFFVVFDADGHVQDKYKAMHERDNRRLLRLLGRDQDSPFPAATVWGANYVQWSTDITETVENDLINSLGTEAYEDIKNEARTEFGLEPNLGKNSLFIGHLLYLAKERGGTCQSLEHLATSILSSASN